MARDNAEITLVASGLKTGNSTSETYVNDEFANGQLWINVRPPFPGSGKVVAKLQSVVPGSTGGGAFVTIAATTMTATGVKLMCTVGPGCSSAAKLAQAPAGSTLTRGLNMPFPCRYKVTSTQTGSSAINWSLGAFLS